MKRKILFLVNHDVVIYNFRRELVEELLAQDYQIFISSPDGDGIEKLKKINCQHIVTAIDRRGMNPLKDLRLLIDYIKMIAQVKPDVVFTYTIKPNVYGGLACRWTKTPYVTNVTGLGSAIENGGLKKKMVLFLYKLGTKNAERVFFQNEYNQKYMLQNGVKGKANGLLPGSGVNLEQHHLEPYPALNKEGELLFLIIGRLMKDKGTDEVLYAARRIKEEYPHVTFRLLGFYDGDYEAKVKAGVDEGIIEYLGQVSDVHAHIKESHATIHASYHEGMANALLETAACGRPVIATDIPGSRETFVEGVSGISCRPRDGESLVCAIRKFIQLPYEEKIRMGLEGRRKMELEFDRQIVIEQYLRELEHIGETEHAPV